MVEVCNCILVGNQRYGIYACNLTLEEYDEYDRSTLNKFRQKEEVRHNQVIPDTERQLVNYKESNTILNSLIFRSSLCF